ncbi:hypothetical protein AAIB33_07350 [Microbacterium sp. AZCO]|uniref:hypothetical protein n=1 Tax=Microbacterium sp. AZCO TaxID=3142976 RepID=UPI0031F3636D
MTAPANDRSRLHSALSDRQALALIQESQSALNLMRDSIDAIRGLRHPLLHGDAIFTLGSIGVEKIAKILLGCAAVERAGAWPSMKTLLGWGHDIDKLSRMVTETARGGIGQSTATGYSETVLSRIEQSTILPLLFATFSRYGRSGRFHYLDVLATDELGDFESPHNHWSRLENHVTYSDPATFGGPISGDWGDLDAQLVHLAEVIADELEIWWFAVHICALQGRFGSLGKRAAFVIWDPARAVPREFA